MVPELDLAELDPREFVEGDGKQTARFFTRIKLPLERCPGVGVGRDCLYCKTVHLKPSPSSPSSKKKRKRQEDGLVLVLDTETTGMTREDQVIQIGYVVLDAAGEVVEEVEEMWQTNQKMNPFAQRVHGITPQDLLRQAVDPRRGLARLQAAMKAAKTVVAHNAAFDTRMLRQTAYRVGAAWTERPVFCTMKAVRQRSVAERGTNAKNGQVYTFLGGAPCGKMHRALADCRATAFIYRHGRDKRWWR